VICPRCQGGWVYWDYLDEVEVCINCGYRPAPLPMVTATEPQPKRPKGRPPGSRNVDKRLDGAIS